MTTKVTITNSSTNTASDRHCVGVAILQSPDQVQVSSHVLEPGESQEFFVYGGQALRIVELPPSSKPKNPAQGTQN